MAGGLYEAKTLPSCSLLNHQILGKATTHSRHRVPIFLHLFIYFYREREGEREGEKHQCVVASSMSPQQGPGLQLRHVLDWESNWQPLSSQAGAQSTDPHQPGPEYLPYFLDHKMHLGFRGGK